MMVLSCDDTDVVVYHRREAVSTAHPFSLKPAFLNATEGNSQKAPCD